MLLGLQARIGPTAEKRPVKHSGTLLVESLMPTPDRLLTSIIALWSCLLNRTE